MIDIQSYCMSLKASCVSKLTSTLVTVFKLEVDSFEIPQCCWYKLVDFLDELRNSRIYQTHP